MNSENNNASIYIDSASGLSTTDLLSAMALADSAVTTEFENYYFIYMLAKYGIENTSRKILSQFDPKTLTWKTARVIDRTNSFVISTESARALLNLGVYWKITDDTLLIFTDKTLPKKGTPVKLDVNRPPADRIRDRDNFTSAFNSPLTYLKFLNTGDVSSLYEAMEIADAAIDTEIENYHAIYHWALHGLRQARIDDELTNMLLLCI